MIEDGHDWIQHLSDQGVVVFDDATRYPDVRQAIDDLVADGTCRLYGDAFGQAYAGRRAHAAGLGAHGLGLVPPPHPSPARSPLGPLGQATAEGFGRRGAAGPQNRGMSSANRWDLAGLPQMS